MAEIDLFQSLVLGLSLNERQELLERLKKMSNKNLESLYFDHEPPETKLRIEEQFFQLSWFSRLAYYVMSLFASKSPAQIFEDRQVLLLQKKIDHKNPGLYDYQSSKLLAPFFYQMNLLKTASRFFYSALDAGFNRDKGAFFAFLGSLEMPGVHTQIQAAMNPELLDEKNPEASESELKHIASRYIEDALKVISDKERAAMYYDARSLHCLKELAFFPFDRILLAFSIDMATKDYACTFKIVKDLMISLNNILFSLKRSPPLTLLESLFIFILQEKSGVSDVDINTDIKNLLSDAEESLEVIRDFNIKIPLTKIIRCASRNASLQPKEIAGGEDWYSVYRDYWKTQVEKTLLQYLRGKRNRKLHDTFSMFLNHKEIIPLENIYSDTNPEGVDLRGAMSLSFLRAFYSFIFMPEINRVLKPVVLDGEFARKENRVEFNESYNVFINIEDDIKALENKISYLGEYGKRLAAAQNEMTSLAIKRRKLQAITDEASTEALGIIQGVHKSCNSMNFIIDGILGKDTTDKYGRLINHSHFVEKNVYFINKLNFAKSKFSKILEILEEMDNLRIG